MNLPHFLIIGAMKSATTTLHEQLAHQPGIFMSNPKEPCYFSDDCVYAQGPDWYAALFANARPGDLCGESSTHYTKLPTYPHTVERIKALLPDVKCIYVMRHPIDRLVSHYIHEWSQRVISVPIDDAIDQHPELIAYSRYTYQLAPYFEAFGPDRVLPVFNERIRHHPAHELRRVCHFIGYTAATPQWREDAAQANKSDQRLRKSKLRDAIAYAPGISQIRERLVPQSVRDRIKNLWRMRERPTLSPESEAKLKQIFDEDLATLGDWLGLPLTCDTFKAALRDHIPQWSDSIHLRQSAPSADSIPRRSQADAR